MEAAVQYMVPVTVFVDTETNEVVRVLQEYENIFLPDMPDVYDESWNPIDAKGIIDNVLDIAESADWPVWDRA